MEKDFYAKVFGWLFIGLLITFGSGYLLSNTPTLLVTIFSGPIYWLIFIAEIGIAIFLSTRIHSMKPITAKVLYLAYTALTGITFATLFLMFKISSILFIFLISALVFGVFALIGKFTKIDLSKFGVFLAMILLGTIVLSFINMFFMNGTLNLVLCIASLAIFMGYIAYDMQRIKQIAETGSNHDNLAVIGAFELYLDFINVFIKLLQLFGKERD